MNDALYAAELKLIEERGNQVVFGGNPDATWGASEELDDPARPMEAGELVIDRRFWLLLGKPDRLAVGFANEVGWEKWVGPTPTAKVASWLEASKTRRTDGKAKG